MQNKLYVGNLAFSIMERVLEDLFSQVGDVREVSIISDKMTGQSRGFGFVTMADEAGAQAAINQFNERDFQGRNLTVNIARERESRPSGGGGGGGGNRRQSRCY